MTELLAKLEPFLLLARSTKGAAAAKVILDATAAPGVYVFAELLDLPNIEALREDPTFGKHHALLFLFAYGTLQDYSGREESFPTVTKSHLQKLKHLTLVSLASRYRSLPYNLLLSELQLESTRQLEALIIDVIYAGLLGAKMHHHQQVLHIDWVGGRDVSPQALLEVQNGLQNWCKTAENLLQSLDEQIRNVRQAAAEEAQALNEYTKYKDEQRIAISSEARDNAFMNTRSGGAKKGGFSKVEQLGQHPDIQGGTGSSKAGSSKGGRNLARNLSSPDELAGLRRNKRPKD